MALDDVDLLTSIQSVDLLQRTFRQHPDHFVICDHQQRAYIMTNSAIHIARARNVLALAELCKLTLSEIHSGIATPLLRAIGIDVACPLGQPSETPVDVRHADRCPEFVPAKPFGAQRDLDDEEKRLLQFMERFTHHPLWHNIVNEERSEKWKQFSSWFGDYARPNPSLLATFKTQRQQQAIIQSRQHRAALQDKVTLGRKRRKEAPPTTDTNSYSSSSPSSSSTCSSSSCSPCSSRDTTPPASIRLSRSVAELQRPMPIHNTNSSNHRTLPPPSPVCRGGLADQILHPRKWASLQDIRHHHNIHRFQYPNHNLDLLATQALSQRRSDAVTPPPPPPNPSAITLPSPREMLAQCPPPHPASGIV
ncbi:hypothetical protein VTP01DRAFT_10706 [Rhizomucor pusillus]|uniref:uncharacterized protein n=1 Tax=Rhizomucor pusillus TaxID=4840 RepID=UPI0037428ADB